MKAKFTTTELRAMINEEVTNSIKSILDEHITDEDIEIDEEPEEKPKEPEEKPKEPEEKPSPKAKKNVLIKDKPKTLNKTLADLNNDQKKLLKSLLMGNLPEQKKGE